MSTLEDRAARRSMLIYNGVSLAMALLFLAATFLTGRSLHCCIPRRRHGLGLLAEHDHFHAHCHSDDQEKGAGLKASPVTSRERVVIGERGC